MPIYEYVCQDCHRPFEKLVSASTVVACPTCESEQVSKQLSVFGVGKAAGSAPSSMSLGGGCGSCGDPRGPGACSMN
jgi:putative FmdB family regulatory protein